MYGTSSNCWYYGLEDGIKAVKSQEGFTQGDVLATWAYIMTIHPFLQGIKSILSGIGFVKFFVDDGNIAAPHDVMINVLQYISEVGPKYGYNIKKTKGSYLIGKCGAEVASQRKQHLVEVLGFNEDIIHIHPDDDPDVESGEKYGMKILGTFVGSDDYVKKGLAKYYDKELTTVAEKLKNVKDLQTKFILLKHCFCPKIIHTLRTVRPDLTFELTEKFEGLKKNIFVSILGEQNIEDIVWEQCGFAVPQGGCGLGNVKEIAHAAFAASLIDCYKTMKDEFHMQEILRDEGVYQGKTVRHLEAFLSMFRKFKNFAPDQILDLDNFLDIRNTKTQTIQGILTDHATKHKILEFKNKLENSHLAWVSSLECSEAGRWLLVIPKRANYQFTNAQFSVQLRYRLFMAIPDIVEGFRCDCSRKVMLDRKGHHLATGCGREGMRHRTHDFLALQICNLCNYGGFYTKREELGCFKESNADDNKKPDISIMNPLPFQVQQDQRKLVLDVSVTCPLQYNLQGTLTTITRHRANKKGQAAETAFKAKNKKYLESATRNKLGFLPIILESTGRVHPKSLELFKTIASKAEESTRIHSENLMCYLMNNISCTLQRSISTAIIRRMRTINSHNTQVINSYDMSHAAVNSHDQYRIGNQMLRIG
jgi:hypothetical protein